MIAFQRPFKLLATQPIVQFVGFYMAFLYGLMYFVLSTFPRLWDTKYHETVGIGGLNYISAGLGFMVGAQFNAYFQDRVYALLTARAGGTGTPEFRIPLMVPGAVLVPIGILIYAWTSEYVVFWLWPNVGVFILSAGMIVCFQCMQVYIVQTYTQYAASALAASTVLRCLAGFGFPLFVSQPSSGMWQWHLQQILKFGQRQLVCTTLLGTGGETRCLDSFLVVSDGLLL
jgi:hypothetical protein